MNDALIRLPGAGHSERCTCEECRVAAEDRTDWLKDAADLVEEVFNTLNRAERPCKACGCKVRTNWTEYQAAQELEAVIRKLQDLSRRLAPRKQRGEGGEA